MWNKRKNGTLTGQKMTLRFAAFFLTCAMTVSVLYGCGAAEETAEQTAPSAGETASGSSPVSGSEETGAEALADVIAPDKEVEQTVSIRTDASGSVAEVRVKDNIEDFEEPADPSLLPFSVRVRYFLDGEEKKPEEMAGVSGRVTIRFEYENLTEQTVREDGKDVLTQVPFLFLSAVILPEEHFSNVETEHGGVSSFKNNTVAYGYALPGWRDKLALDALQDRMDSVEFDFEEDEKNGKTEEPAEEEDAFEFPEYVEIRADATEFELDFTATVVSNGLLKDMKTDSMDNVDELIGNIHKFTDAGDELADGVGKLHDGAGEFRDALKKYTDAVGQVNSGAGQLSDALSKLDKALSGIDLDGLNGGAGDLSKVQEAMQKVTEDGETIKKLLGGLDALSDAAKNMTPEAMNAIAQQAAQAVSAQSRDAAKEAAYAQIAGNDRLTEEEKQAIASAAGEAAANAAEEAAKRTVKEMLAGYGIDVSAVDTDALGKAAADLSSNLQVLAGYASVLKEGGDLFGSLGEVSGQLKELQSGISQLSSGASKLASGTAQLSSAGGQLVNGYDKLNDGIGEFEDGVKEFNEKGIQKFGELAGEELRAVLRGLRAMRMQDRSYTSLEGGRENGSVRFILETEEIKRNSAP